jgi:hypothetical protein
MGDISSALRSSDVVVLGNEELGLLGFPRVPLLPTYWGQVVGHGTSVLASHDRALAAMGDTSHGWSGCSATGPGDSNKTSPPDFSQFFLL